MQVIKNFQPKKREVLSALPAGGYVAKIKGARVDDYSWGSVLVVAFDIAEGDYAGYFDKKYKSSTFEGKKWQGTMRLIVPDESSKYYTSNLSALEGFIWSVENSNNGYAWNWNESSLVGKMVGIIFREKEYDFDGRTGWTTECTFTTDVSSIRNGDFKIPKPKALNGATKTAAANSVDILTEYEEISTDTVPF